MRRERVIIVGYRRFHHLQRINGGEEGKGRRLQICSSREAFRDNSTEDGKMEWKENN